MSDFCGEVISGYSFETINKVKYGNGRKDW